MKPYPLNHADRMLAQLDEHAISGAEPPEFSQLLVQESWRQGERLSDLVTDDAPAEQVLARYKAIRGLFNIVFRSEGFHG